MKSNYKNIGDHIKQVDVRNSGLRVKKLVGLSISKEFIPSVANIIGTDMENYKIIRKDQFACSTMQVRRDKKMPVALFQENEAIISQAYPVFEVKDESQLLPEYLMMWFTREEFDREACFNAVGGVRGSLEWEDFETMKLPIPKINIQRALVAEYKSIQDRIKLNQELIQKLEEAAQAIYKEWFLVKKDEDWRTVKLGELVETQYGYTATATDEKVGPKFLRITDIAQDQINWNKVPYCPISENEFEKYKLKYGDIVVARTGATSGYAKRIHKRTPVAVFASFLVRLIPCNKDWSLYLGLVVDSKTYREFVLANAEGSAQPQANAPLLTSFELTRPDDETVLRFNKIIEPIFDLIEFRQIEIEKLNEFRNLLLAKMASV